MQPSKMSLCQDTSRPWLSVLGDRYWETTGQNLTNINKRLVFMTILNIFVERRMTTYSAAVAEQMTCVSGVNPAGGSVVLAIIVNVIFGEPTVNACVGCGGNRKLA